MQARPRQTTFIDACCDALDEHGNTIGIAPTGAGKTFCLSSVASRYLKDGASALVLQHRDVLVSQNRETFERVNVGVSTGLFTADRKEWGYQTTFAMMQTLAMPANLEGMPPFDFMAIDEGHHAVAPSYMRIIDRAYKLNPDMKLLLVTATPNRSDRKGLRSVVSNVADEITMKELVASGHLVKPRAFVIDVGVDDQLAAVAAHDTSAVEAIMDKEVVTDAVIEKWREHAGNRKTAFFCATVDHAAHVCDALNAAGIKSICVESRSMTPTQQGRAIAAFEAGEYQCILNVQKLTEGWDYPPLSCVVLLTKESAAGSTKQKVGRGMRTIDPVKYPGVIKDDCIILDFGLSIRNGNIFDEDVDLDQSGTKDCPECKALLPARVWTCSICGHEFDRPEDGLAAGAGSGDEARPREELTDFIMTEIDLLNASPFRYENLFGGIVSLASAINAWAVIVHWHGRWHAIGGADAVGIRPVANSADRLIAMAAADDFMREHGDRSAGRKTKRWMTEPPTDKQLNILRLQRMQALGMTKYHATCLLQWKFSERAIRTIIEGRGALAA